MESLTPFERALLAQFESLASGCEASLRQSEATASALSDLSTAIGRRIAEIEERQEALSAHLDDLASALTRQTLHTRALIDAVNRLMAELAK